MNDDIPHQNSIHSIILSFLKVFFSLVYNLFVLIGNVPFILFIVAPNLQNNSPEEPKSNEVFLSLRIDHSKNEIQEIKVNNLPPIVHSSLNAVCFVLFISFFSSSLFPKLQDGWLINGR